MRPLLHSYRRNPLRYRGLEYVAKWRLFSALFEWRRLQPQAATIVIAN